MNSIKKTDFKLTRNKILKNILLFLGSFFLGCSVKVEPSINTLLSVENIQIDNKTFELTPFKPKVVNKISSIPTFAHFMPWFESKEISEHWGSHWTMANRNPDIIDSKGKRQIASHFYPIVGPYDSGDSDYLEYALLCLKLTGFDGVFINYYGNTDLYDYVANLENTLAIIKMVKKVGLHYSLVYEDKTATEGAINNLGSTFELVKLHFQYMKEHFFDEEAYVKYQKKPLLLIFGPQSDLNKEQWDTLIGDSINLVGLEHEIKRLGFEEDMIGVFVWDTTEKVKEIYNNCEIYHICIGSAMPGFKDYYQEGGWGETLPAIDSKNGQHLKDMLTLASQMKIDYLQIPTWNDWGEGTMIEPSLEFGYQRLEILQEWFGVPYNSDELKLTVLLYQKRKEYKGKIYENQILDQVFYYLVSLQIDKANALLKKL
jgi:hypothetical protein